MKIIIFNTLYYPYQIGGAERSVQLLAESLNNNGDEVTVVTLHDGNDVEQVNYNGVDVVKLPLLNSYWPWGDVQGRLTKLFWHIRDIYNNKMLEVITNRFANETYDVVHTNNLCGFSVAVWEWAKERNFPIVHTARDYYLMNPNAKLFRKGENHSPKTIDSLAFSFIKKREARKVTKFVGISQYIKKLHVQNDFFRNDISEVIYNSIDITRTLGPDKRKYKDGGMVTFGYLGRIEENKGIEFLLNALDKLGRDDLNLLVAGKGDDEYLRFLERKYSKINFKFIGTVKINDFFPQIDYLITPSLWNEPFGRVVVEANSFGIPVLGSSRGGIPEIIVENETGFVFDADDQHSLVTLLQNVLMLSDHEYSMLSENSFLFSQKFSSENVMREYVKIYDDAIKSNSAVRM